MTQQRPQPGNATLSNEDLLNKYSSLQRWFGDDFCVHLPEDSDYAEGEMCRAEVLRRMDAQCGVQNGDAETYVAWVAFAENGNVRFWTNDYNRSIEEKRRGLDLRAFTLAELVALVGRPREWQPIETAARRDGAPHDRGSSTVTSQDRGTQ